METGIGHCSSQCGTGTGMTELQYMHIHCVKSGMVSDIMLVHYNYITMLFT